MRNFILIFFCLTIAVKAFATMTVMTGQGYYIYNGQVIGYYNLKYGQHDITDDVSYIETNGVPSVEINKEASCRYLQIHNPNSNIVC